MLPPKSGASTNRTDSRQINYFKLENVPPTDDGIACTIQGVRNEKTRFGDYRVKLLVAGVVYYWDVKVSWPVHDVLVEHLGQDETKWTGKQFTAFHEYDEFAGRSFIGARFEDAPKPKRK